MPVSGSLSVAATSSAKNLRLKSGTIVGTMLPKQHRFHGNKSLRFVMSRGRSVRTADMSLKSVHNKRAEQFRVAVVVSKKVSKSAVVRNRIRRRIYAAVADYRSQLDRPYDLVFFIYSNSVAELAYPELNQRVAKLLKQAEIIA